MKKRRRPKRSARRPAGTSAAAKTIVYAFRIHERRFNELPGNDALMSGKAMFTIVTSRKLMKTPTDVTSSTCQRRAITDLPTDAPVHGARPEHTCSRLSQGP